ncbi:MAG: Flp pilus assembly protein CpaB [Acidimicrobiales bacterium]
MLSHSSRSTTPSPAASPPEARRVHRRRGLPSGRAVVGGFLVAAGAVGIFSAYQGASGGRERSYVTANRDIAAGEHLRRSDLSVVALDLTDELRRLAVSSPDALVGTTTLAPVLAGQLIWRSGVVKPDGSPQLAQISIPVHPANALGGRLLPGERVDVLLTSTAAGAPQVTTISSGARVVRVDAGDRTVGSSGAMTLVLAVAPEELERLAEAAAAGTVTVARVTGLGWSDDDTLRSSHATGKDT